MSYHDDTMTIEIRALVIMIMFIGIVILLTPRLPRDEKYDAIYFDPTPMANQINHLGRYK